MVREFFDRWDRHRSGPLSVRSCTFLYERLGHISPDLLRDFLATFIDALLGAEPDAISGAQRAAVLRAGQRAQRLP